MSVQRTYSLPNCTLAVQGWSTETDPTRLRPTLTALTGVECQFLGRDPKLSGGRDFLEGLIAAVNAYTQERLSGVSRAKPQIDEHQRVRLQAGATEGTHALIVAPAPDENGSDPVRVELSAVQLFDLVEAIDQLLSDRSTLPDLALALEPLPRRLRVPDKPLSERARPVAIGAAGFAAAAAAFFMVPVPEVRDPESTNAIADSALETADSNAVATSVPPEIETILADALPVPAEQRADLQADLRSRLESDWQAEAALAEPLAYRVWVDAEGQILGYRALGSRDRPVAPAPLLSEIASIPETDSDEPLQVVQYRVAFAPDGSVEVTPWNAEE